MLNRYLVIAFAALYILVTAFASELFDFSFGGGGALEFKRSKAAKSKVKSRTTPVDVEQGTEKREEPTSGSSSDTLDPTTEEALQDISGSESIFTWQNVEYTVPYL